MLIKDHESCEHRLPGMPYIGVEPGCSLTATETPCENPTYEKCPRYIPVTAATCPCCHGSMFKDEVDWNLVCSSCDATFQVPPGVPKDCARSQAATG